MERLFLHAICCRRWEPGHWESVLHASDGPLALSGVLALLEHAALNEQFSPVSFLGCLCCADSLPAL